MNSPSPTREFLERAWLAALDMPPTDFLPEDAKFYDQGGTSLRVIMLHTLLEEGLDVSVDIVELFDSLATLRFGDWAKQLMESTSQVTGSKSGVSLPTPSAGRVGAGDELAVALPSGSHVAGVPDRSGLVSIGDRIAVLAREFPDRTALIEVRPDGTEIVLTWSEALDRINAAARALEKRGVGEESTVIVGLPNGIDHVVTTLATWMLGARVIPVNPALPEREYTELIGKVPGAFAVGTRPSEIQVTELDGEDRSYVPARGVPRSAALTGGSTGTSRIVCRRHPWLYDPEQSTPAGYELPGFRFGQVQLVALPMYHGGFLELHNGLAMGHTVVIMVSFAPTLLLRLVERHRVNFFLLVPTQMRAVAAVHDVPRYDLSSVEAMYHQSAKCPEAVKRRWLEILPPERVYEDYGSVENVGYLRIRGDEWLEHPGSVGRPGNGVEVRVVGDDGQDVPPGTVGAIYLKSPGAVQPTYLGGGPDLPENDGFLTVGDLGYLDEEGYLHLVDRRSNVINVGGLNIHPSEIEDVLLELDSVADAAVTGRRHAILGERVHALVVRGSSGLTEEQLMAHCRARLALSKVPHAYEFVDQLPRDSSGKLRRHEL
ncbi:AMP-binding protein [Streptomyces sp. CNQ-509]|uniref:AMP-binding protein n=1 Tax=Streptomyces sp. CNQ-509 TaxID=444103 RepID=UPI00099D144F|nr:AMP-binding protein [Streptomyces sp. CNQ-509]